MRARLAALFVLGAAGGWTIAQVGCSSSSTPPAPVATGSGAFGVVTVNGKQVMYLPLTSLSPAGNGQIAVVDVGIVPAPGHNVDDAGTPALVTNIDLGTFDQATATAGDSSVVVAAGTATHKVWFIDPSTNKVVHTT